MYVRTLGNKSVDEYNEKYRQQLDADEVNKAITTDNLENVKTLVVKNNYNRNALLTYFITSVRKRKRSISNFLFKTAGYGRDFFDYVSVMIYDRDWDSSLARLLDLLEHNNVQVSFDDLMTVVGYLSPENEHVIGNFLDYALSNTRYSQSQYDSLLMATEKYKDIGKIINHYQDMHKKKMK